MGANLPPDLRTARIHAIMSGWTASNHQEAGNWLVRAPDTPGKDLAVRTYVVMVAPIAPGISEQWAMTLPPGPNRDELLKEVHRKWPKELDLKKEAFAARHGIK